MKLRIIVLGYVVRGPLGGMAWSNLHYLMALSRLGHDVYFVEDSDDYESCYDPLTHRISNDATYGLRFAADTFTRIGFGERWAYYDAHISSWTGPASGAIVSLCKSADLVLNLACVNPLRAWLESVPVRAYVDEDPVFTQIRHLTDPAARQQALKHNYFFSFGENIGAATCTVPDDGINWKTTRQPVVLDALPVTPGPIAGRYTTVMQWQSYPAREYNGVHYGLKDDSFEIFLDLPRNAGHIFELACGGNQTPRDLLVQKGWMLRDPLPITRDPWTYEDYIRASKAEFGIAKHGYVVSRSGWFSERSACYLASGRPVVIQDTGFTTWLPSGEGLIAFKTPEDALSAIETINDQYDSHCRAAREIAAAFFDANKVISKLLADMGFT
jgi:hypothetical protein